MESLSSNREEFEDKAKILFLNTKTDSRGHLTICEEVLPFEIKRLFWIYQADGEKRGGHGHKKTNQAIVCLHGSCEIYLNNGKREKKVFLDSPHKLLLLPPEDWHSLENFKDNATVLVMASEIYNPNDYFFEKPKI